MEIALGELTIDCIDTRRVAEFWGRLLDREVHAGEPGWFEISPLMPGGPRFNFQPVQEAKTTKTRVHLDLWVDDLDAAIALAERSGGRRLGEMRISEAGRWTVMADPEGTEFCLVALPAEM
jgi:predicted enzyme related to lactoylglutathione lyase